MIIFIKRKKYVLSKRKTVEVNNLAEFTQDLTMPEEGKAFSAEVLTNSFAVSAQMINDSIKATYKNFSFLRRLFAFKYRRFLKNGPFIILQNLSPEDLNVACLNIAEMEGSKKNSGSGKVLGRDVVKGLINLHYHIPLDEVEELDIDDYRLKIFTIFNDAILHSMDAREFRFQTDEESTSELARQIETAIKKGYSL